MLKVREQARKAQMLSSLKVLTKRLHDITPRMAIPTGTLGDYVLIMHIALSLVMQATPSSIHSGSAVQAHEAYSHTHSYIVESGRLVDATWHDTFDDVLRMCTLRDDLMFHAYVRDCTRLALAPYCGLTLPSIDYSGLVQSHAYEWIESKETRWAHRTCVLSSSRTFCSKLL